MKPNYLVKWGDRVGHVGNNGNLAANDFLSLVSKVLRIVFRSNFENGRVENIVFEDRNHNETMIITIETKKIEETELQGDPT